MNENPNFEDDELDAQGYRDAIGVAMQANIMAFHAPGDGPRDSSGFVALTTALLAEFADGEIGLKKFQFFCLGFSALLDSAHQSLGVETMEEHQAVLMGYREMAESVPTPREDPDA